MLWPGFNLFDSTRLKKPCDDWTIYIGPVIVALALLGFGILFLVTNLSGQTSIPQRVSPADVYAYYCEHPSDHRKWQEPTPLPGNAKRDKNATTVTTGSGKGIQ